jgi:hypothetical protein
VSVLLSGIIGGVAGLFKFLLTKHMDMKHQQQMALMEKAGIAFKSRRRAAGVKDEGIAFTRRILSILLCTTLCVPVWYSIVYPDAVINIPQTVLERGFWDWLLPWKEGKEVTKYVAIKGSVIAMPIYDLCAMVVGFYFGGGGSRGR